MPSYRRVLAAALTVPVLAAGGIALVPSAQAASKSVPKEFTFSGAGWGHGVGMSQYGAYGMAKEGASATTILKHYYTGTTVAAYNDNKNIAVNLLHRSSGVKLRSEKLTTGGGALTVDLGATEFDGTMSDTVSFKPSGTKVAVYKNGKKSATVASATVRWAGTTHPSTTTHDDTKATLVNVVGSSSSFTSSGHRYRYGYLKVVPRTVSGVTKLEVVEVLRLHDEYLRGLGEVPSSWPKAALQAQVVAARSFALVKYNAGLRGGCQCHVYDTVADQNYVGYVKESSSYGSAWRAAVTATNSTSTTSKTVLYKGKPIQAFYSSSTGGRTQNVKDVWGSSIPYLVSVDDHWSTEKKYNPSFYVWGPKERTQKQVATAFGLSDVARVDLSSKYVSGALKQATAYSAAGKKATLTVGTFVARLSMTSNWVKKVSSAGSVAVKKSAPTAIKAFPLPTSKKYPKTRYYGYVAAHKNLAKSRVYDGRPTGNTTTKRRAEIRSIQTWLKGLGYLKAAPDGGFGPATHAAVKKFQKAHKIKATGLVGGGATNKTGTWKALQVAYRKR